MRTRERNDDQIAVNRSSRWSIRAVENSTIPLHRAPLHGKIELLREEDKR
jgi:hypothetical protein